MKPATPEAFKLLMDGSTALSQIEGNGIAINVDYLDRAITKIGKKVKQLHDEMREDKVYKIWRKRFGEKANLDSTQQLAKVIYDDLGYECKAWTKSKLPSTSEKHLQDVDHPFVKKLFERKHLAKALSTNLKGIRREVVDGFLHPVFNLHTAASYRSSCELPNFQNLPRRNETIARIIRSCIIPRKGRHFWEIDFKGSEICWNANYNRDPVLIDYIKTDPGAMHRDAAADLFMIRKDQVVKRARDRAKNQFVFASFYGSYYVQTSRNLWDDLHRDKSLTVGEGGIHILEHLRSKGIKRLGACDPRERPRPNTFEAHVQKIDDLLWKRFSVYKQWRDDWWAEYQRKGYFHTLTGFRIDWPAKVGPESLHDDSIRGGGGCLSRNDTWSYPAQGSSFHGLLWFIIQLQKWLNKNKMKTKSVGQIHDSAEGDSPPDELQDVLGKAREIVTVDLPKHWPCIIVPLGIDIEVSDVDRSWYEKKPWELRNGTWRPKETQSDNPLSVDVGRPEAHSKKERR